MALKENDFVILKKDANMKVIQLIKNRLISIWKLKFTLDGVIGHQYGTSFFVSSGHLVKADVTDIDNEEGEKGDEFDYSAIKDNRNLVDNRSNQQLSKEEIQNLRKQGASGGEIVGQLIENSSTFAEKNEFSQKKYIKKKLKKHGSLLTVLKPTARNVLEMYFTRSPAKICYLRMDSLSQLLTYSNVRSGSRILVVDTCHGLVLGALLERMNGCGNLINLYTGSAPCRPAVTDGFHFSDEVLSCLQSFPLDQIYSLQRHGRTAACQSTQSKTSCEQSSVNISSSTDLKESTSAEQCGQNDETFMETADTPSDDDDNDDAEAVSASAEKTETASTASIIGRAGGRKRKYESPEEREKQRQIRLQQIHNAKKVIEDEAMDGLIIAGRLYPTPIALSLLDFVKPSRPLVVFCPYKEPLIDCFIALRETGRVLMMTVSETWLRGYQVLPERTHPLVKMSGCGGYLLTATVVAV